MTFEEFIANCHPEAAGKDEASLLVVDLKDGIWPKVESVYMNFDRFATKENFYSFYAVHGQEMIKAMYAKVKEVKAMHSEVRKLQSALEDAKQALSMHLILYGMSFDHANLTT